MNNEQSEILALQALTYLAGDEEKLGWMITESGISPTDLANSPDRQEVLAGVLDFLLGHEEILIDFCQSEGLDPTSPARARQFLPGAVQESY
jgi:hypothetical protein